MKYGSLLLAATLFLNLSARAADDKSAAEDAVKQKLASAFAAMAADQRKWEKERGNKAEKLAESKEDKKAREKAEKAEKKAQKERAKGKEYDGEVVEIPRARAGASRDGGYFEIGGLTTRSRSSSSGYGRTSSESSYGNTSIGVRTTVIKLDGPED